MSFHEIIHKKEYIMIVHVQDYFFEADISCVICSIFKIQNIQNIQKYIR